MNEPSDTRRPTKKESVAPIRFKQARAVFEAALDKPSGERRRYVESACVGDEALLRDVEGMLAADAGSESLREPAAEASGSTSSSAPEEGRFPAGTVLAGRYRILGLLGKGGMGEVYRAFDIILNQTVALKFLTESRWTEAALIRFRNEVRVARQVSHPNVCRVYDLGMVDGLHFLSMEYIDGEDLAALLRRIGRLPEDKAMEFTRKICAGLAAAHERGVLHRDLKPANVMIDGRGHVRITDFGLAGLVEEIPSSDLGSGTPAYMSPEQKAGREVSVQSDVYSLGMILHEMFTGHPPDPESGTQPTDYVKGLDPAIERVIVQCLAEDPRRRPSSALRVAMALPGGNAIAAALAAGETPSPEAVAASEEKEGFTFRSAAVCLLVIVACFAASLAVASRFGFIARANLAVPPDELTYRARMLLEDLGYDEPPAGTASGWICCDDGVRQRLEAYPREQLPEILASHRPPLIQFYYRQHRAAFRPGAVTYDDPLNTEPGMIRLRLDASGRLLHLHVEPWPEEQATPSAASEAALMRLLDAAELDASRLSGVEPERLPPMMADERKAWTGTFADRRDEPVRVEAAFWQGKPVLFEVAGPAGTETFTYVDYAFVVYLVNLLFLLLCSILLLAWHRTRGNRLDVRGAFVLTGAVVTFGIVLTLPDFFRERVMGFEAILLPLATWLIYIAIEPLARRHWPDSLISWTRLTRGRVRNTLVASHILAGIVLAEVFGVFSGLRTALDPVPVAGGVQIALNDTIGSAFAYLFSFSLGIPYALTFLGFIVLARLVIRKAWIADLAAVAAMNLQGLVQLASPTQAAVTDFLSVLLFTLVLIWMMRRFGFLSVLTVWVFALPAALMPLTATGWLAERLILWHAIPVAVAAWALWVIVTDRRSPTPELPV